MVRRFHEAHRARYGYSVLTETVEVVNARLTASAGIALRRAPRQRPAARAAPARASVTRDLWIDGAFAKAGVLLRAELHADDRAAGPAIVEAYDSTTYVRRDGRSP